MQNNRVDAKIVDDLFSPDNDGVAGRIKYYRSNTPGADDLAGANFWCPCGCRELLSVSFAPGRWTWDGNREKPTVRPSILHVGGCGYHGWLTNGVFERC